MYLVSPYSTQSTMQSNSIDSSSNQWPKTRVGDFILTFPWNEATRKAATGHNVDIKLILREQQKIMKVCLRCFTPVLHKIAIHK